MQKWPLIQVIDLRVGVLMCVHAAFLCLVSLKWKGGAGRLVLLLLVCYLQAYRRDECGKESRRRSCGGLLASAASIERWRTESSLHCRALHPNDDGDCPYNAAFVQNKAELKSRKKCMRNYIGTEVIKDGGSKDEGEEKVVTPSGAEDRAVNKTGGFSDPFVIAPWGKPRKERVKIARKPLTIADIIRKRLIPQPPSLKYTQRVLARKPWKRMDIPSLIKREKQRIEETDKFLDNYFYTYLVRRGADAGLGGGVGVKCIDRELFKTKQRETGGGPDGDRDEEKTSRQYTADELIQIWDTKGGHFYTNIPKTVAVLQLVRRIAKESKADADMLKRIREHECFKRIVGSVVRHMKYVKRIELPKHLKNYPKLMNKVPKFNKEQMVTIFSVFAYLGFNKEKVVEALLEHAKPCKDFEPEEMRAIILACIKMKFDPSQFVGEYIDKLKAEINVRAAPTGAAEGGVEYYLDVLRICNKTDHMDNELFKHIADFFKNQDTLSLDVATNAVWLFTAVQHLDEALYRHLYDALSRDLKEIKAKRVVKKLVTWLAASHFKPPETLVDHLATTILGDIKSYSLVELGEALRNLALMDCYNDALCQKVFSLGLFTKPPTVKVLQQINLQLNKKKTLYAAYLHPTATSTLNVVFGNVYQAYLGYQVLADKPNKFELPKESHERLKVRGGCVVYMAQDIYTAGAKNWTFSSSSFHIQVRDLINEAFGIECEIEHVTSDGLLVDIAILPSSLAKLTEKLGAKDFLKDKRCAIEVHGPFHYLQKSTDAFPPPLNNTTVYKER
ncbi:RAP protein, putative [Babesia caballi]|uniref:RAP protein, putative n=1 Tax=Babesia caballi TaxID=5871 RepID=A0AAV4LQE2_BABCB|nr:RAP protein, putative [Babesia caballi]